MFDFLSNIINFIYNHFYQNHAKGFARERGVTNLVLITLWARKAFPRYRPLNISERSGFQEVEKLSPEDKNLVKTFLDAFITKKKIQQLAL